MEREVNTKVFANEGGKSRRITKLDAIVKQQTNKAIQGDHKAASLVIKALEPRESDQTDNLSPVLQALRAIHAKHDVANQNGLRGTDVSLQGENAVNDSERDNHDPA